MKKILTSLAGAAALMLMASAASASVVCDSCDFIGQPASNLGVHSPTTSDNSTFSNATTGTNGNFSNWWVFNINPAGLASVNAIFLPIGNISNFDVTLWTVDSSTCAANTPGQSGACTAFDEGVMIADGFTNPAYSTVIDFTSLAAGQYAFHVTGTIAGLTPTQPASYTGNLQVQAVPEPGTLALASMALAGAVFVRRKKVA